MPHSRGGGAAAGHGVHGLSGAYLSDGLMGLHWCMMRHDALKCLWCTRVHGLACCTGTLVHPQSLWNLEASGPNSWATLKWLGGTQVAWHRGGGGGGGWSLVVLGGAVGDGVFCIIGDLEQCGSQQSNTLLDRIHYPALPRFQSTVSPLGLEQKLAWPTVVVACEQRSASTVSGRAGE